MIIKKYVVNNMNEAMTRIRYEMGQDAVIISQRKVKRPGISGFFRKKVLEVTAAAESSNSKRESENYNAVKQLLENSIDRKKEEPAENNLDNSNGNKEILKEIEEMKNVVTSFIDNAYKGNVEEEKEEIKEIKSLLKDNDVSEDIVEKILKVLNGLENKEQLMEKTKEFIENTVKVSSEDLKGAVVLVGPTGVGKTTTIAKLAGRLSLVEKKKVGLITVDTYRIGAVDQLKTYADIMGIPFKVVFSINDMEEAIENMKNCEVVLVDTTGRSSKNVMQISELRAFIEKVNSDNIHLVISSTTKNRDIDNIVEGYKTLGYNNVIITKLDETTTYGSILNIVNSTKKPISFITTGQNVPDDIRAITPKEISSLILGEDNIC
ncbi:flagellar biosynthesis protein FlhF [Clostridium cochlearium]|jgi:flagellar biosynthesis protein FlhF|uniref:Flagellar biosynthesis protein FlhF n=1 Tax=Clostridium cochlearium TaxID=1494 RepID=A0A240ABB7_CLOCO|nr:flagellar biosynthesis protein FlhF [Clostridium cochlearium]NSJ91627.1 flagellar biosynthesis protein FlhF [Coprococcus sp. MSK.21.13]MCG4579434.1 flagellar biosynthesis protein FlhF [Clostridium cochlearium]NMA58288.1 flagellar biosynthesis protein FlhF [Clostridium cochlearium]NME94901.1 flagellar biosynthesis protein FlhF [Clostridium cochlearium]SDL06370.1 flagellar biosynthesis protein FlhF [Clostridium cochlearium]